jgi:hypothetical protein
MVDEAVIAKLRERYAHVNPLIFHRSISYAKSGGDLFDILEGIPKMFPIVWDHKSHQWVTVEDVKKPIFKD